MRASVKMMIRHVVLLVLAATMAVPPGAAASLKYVCNVDGRTRTVCCCNGSDSAPEQCSVVESGCCCDIEIEDQARISAGILGKDALARPSSQPVLLSAPLVGPSSTDSASIVSPLRSLGAPPPNRPLYLQLNSFLI